MRLVVLLFGPVLVLGAGAADAIGLPDSGQDLCDNGFNVLVACGSSNTGDAAAYPRQDGRFGRDAQATAGKATKTGGGDAGFDYTKVANNGSDLQVNASLGTAAAAWACTRDNITGLTWEVKVNDPAHLRHWNWTYSWYNSNVSVNAGDAGIVSGTTNCATAGRCDTEKFAADVNASLLCGYGDWRMPTYRELYTLVHAGTLNPSIDVTYFPNTPPESFWSGTSAVQVRAYAFEVGFYSGGAGDIFGKAHPRHVRLVRGEPF